MALLPGAADERHDFLSDVGIAGQAISTRVVSIGNIFRGITMAVMIFVNNDLASVHGLSKWTYHMPAKVDAMTC